MSHCAIAVYFVEMDRTKEESLLSKFIQFAKETTIHGVPITVAPRLHLLERLFWSVIVVCSIIAAVLLAKQNVIRYYENPTVVSIQKDYRNWYNIFPSATGCFVNKGDEDAIDEFLEDDWGLNDTDPRYDLYRDFILAVANISYQNIGALKRFADDEFLNSVDMLELAKKVHPELTGTLTTFDTDKKSEWTLVMTEMGICFAMNTIMAQHFSLEEVEEEEHILKCHYLNGLCYARYDSDPTAPLKVYIHSYVDIGHATSEKPHHVKESQELEINFQMQQTSPSETIRYLSPKQRKCRYIDEPLDKLISAYSPSICHITCRYRIVMKLCGCKPFFYHKLPGKVCDLKELMCVTKHLDTILQPPVEMKCDCPQPCDFITYLPQVPKITVWEYGYFDQRITFRWGLIPPTTKYNRDVIFGFEDLVVSIGGTVALFLGVSFISGMEIIFFFGNLLLSFIWPKKKKRDQKTEKSKKAQPKIAFVNDGTYKF